MLLSPDYALYIKALIGILAIVNPLGAIPVFLSLSAERSKKERQEIAQISALSVALILIAAAWLGNGILALFGIGVPAFRAGGGLLIILMAIAMLHAKQSHTQHTPAEADEASDKENIAVVPIAIPLMAGPGSISLVIVYAHQAASVVDRLVLTADIVIVAAFVWVSLRLSGAIGEKLGVTGLNIATRIMGLLLAAIGIQMMSAGLVALMPGLA